MTFVFLEIQNAVTSSSFMSARTISMVHISSRVTVILPLCFVLVGMMIHMNISHPDHRRFHPDRTARLNCVSFESRTKWYRKWCIDDFRNEVYV